MENIKKHFIEKILSEVVEFGEELAYSKKLSTYKKQGLCEKIKSHCALIRDIYKELQRNPDKKDDNVFKKVKKYCLACKKVH